MTSAEKPPPSARSRLPERFRRTAGRYPTGVTVLSAMIGSRPCGMTVNSFTAVSISPLLVLVSLSNSSRTAKEVLSAGSFAVTVLAAGQSEEARWFADPDRPGGKEAFARWSHWPAPHSGAPVLGDGVAYFDCRVDAIHPAGDHDVVIGRVLEFTVMADSEPLVFLDSKFRTNHEYPLRSQ